jgi:hypothetical protein
VIINGGQGEINYVEYEKRKQIDAYAKNYK